MFIVKYYNLDVRAKMDYEGREADWAKSVASDKFSHTPHETKPKHFIFFTNYSKNCFSSNCLIWVPKARAGHSLSFSMFALRLFFIHGCSIAHFADF